jgi:hypothetical protein
MAKTKKASKKSGGKSTGRTTAVAKKPEEIRKIRNQVTSVILNGSLAMTNRMVREVSEEGNISALKFLWETARLFPAGEAEEDPNSSDALAKSLLKALGLPTEPPSEDEEEAEETKPEADVESEEGEEGGEEAALFESQAGSSGRGQIADSFCCEKNAAGRHEL